MFRIHCRPVFGIASCLAAGCVAVAGGTSAGAQSTANPSGGTATASPAPALCPSAVQRRELLRDERGQSIYLAADSFAEQDGSLLIVARSTATFGPTAQAPFDVTSQDSILALVRLPNGSVHTFARPDLGDWDIAGVSAVALGRGDWGVLITTQRDTGTTRTRLAGPVWFMRLNARGEPALQQLALPSGVVTDSRSPGDVAELDGRVVFALPAVNSKAEEMVLLLELRNNRWSSRTIAVEQLAYVAVGFDGRSRELVLAIVKPDRTQTRDYNSLYLVRPERQANLFTLVATGGMSPIHLPRIAPSQYGVFIGWHRRTLSSPTGGLYPAFVSRVDYEAVRTPQPIGEAADYSQLVGKMGAAPLFVLARPAAGNSAEIDVHAPIARASAFRLRIPSAASSAVHVLLGDEQLVVTQPAVLGGGTHLASELLWISTRCDAPGGGQ